MDIDSLTMAGMMDPRSCILRVGEAAGRLCGIATRPGKLVPSKDDDDDDDDALVEALAEVFLRLWLTARALKLDWVRSIRSKMALNAKKYPVEHCKVCLF